MSFGGWFFEPGFFGPRLFFFFYMAGVEKTTIHVEHERCGARRSRNRDVMIWDQKNATANV